MTDSDKIAEFTSIDDDGLGGTAVELDFGKPFPPEPTSKLNTIVSDVLKPGRPILLQGVGSSGRSYMCSDLGLAVQNKLPNFWGGKLNVSGPVVHIDGQNPDILRRYNKVYLGRGIRVKSPKIYSMVRSIKAKELTEVCSGASLCIIDNINVVTSHIPAVNGKEDPVGMAEWIGMLTGVSFATQCPIFIVDYLHAATPAIADMFAATILVEGKVIPCPAMYDDTTEWGSQRKVFVTKNGHKKQLASRFDITGDGSFVSLTPVEVETELEMNIMEVLSKSPVRSKNELFRKFRDMNFKAKTEWISDALDELVRYGRVLLDHTGYSLVV